MGDHPEVASRHGPAMLCSYLIQYVFGPLLMIVCAVIGVVAWPYVMPTPAPTLEGQAESMGIALIGLLLAPALFIAVVAGIWWGWRASKLPVAKS